MKTYFEVLENLENLEDMDRDELLDYANLLDEEDHIILDRDRWLTLLDHVPLEDEDFQEKTNEWWKLTGVSFLTS